MIKFFGLRLEKLIGNSVGNEFYLILVAVIL